MLGSFWPGAAVIFADVASPIALAFLERYPTPESAARLGPKRLAGFLAQHQYCGRRSPEALLDRLRSAPEGCAGEAEGEAKGDLVRALGRTLQALVAELARLTSRIEHAIAVLPDGRIVMSFHRAGKICAAQILAELGDVRARFPPEHQLPAEAGVAPVTYQSGKSRGVGWRWACNKRQRAALTCMADNCRHSAATGSSPLDRQHKTHPFIHRTDLPPHHRQGPPRRSGDLSPMFPVYSVTHVAGLDRR